MSDTAIAASQPWYRALNRAQWNTLVASNLGWLFDGYETYAVFLTVGVALRELLDSSQFAQITVYAGTIVALTLLGWGVGLLAHGISVWMLPPGGTLLARMVERERARLAGGSKGDPW